LTNKQTKSSEKYAVQQQYINYSFNDFLPRYSLILLHMLDYVFSCHGVGVN